MKVNILVLSDNLEYIKTLPDNSIDSIITDSPYGLSKKQYLLKILQAWLDHGYLEIKGSGFMGKKWDAFVPQPILWKECLRVLKPGGYLLSFFGTRTYQLGTLAIEIAGFEIRDMICWHYASGFPKNLDIGKEIDKAAGAKRIIIGTNGSIPNHKGGKFNSVSVDGSHTREENFITQANTDDAKKWDGWGNALKPATEPICIARKPLEGTTIENILKWGTGGINIDGCRIAFTDEKDKKSATFGTGINIKNGSFKEGYLQTEIKDIPADDKGRWPANVIFDDFMALKLDQQSGTLTSGKPAGVKAGNNNNIFGQYAGGIPVTGYGDTGGASRFFFCAKTSTAERAGMTHPTIKPIKLMNYLVKMYTPPGGLVLDPHSGSGPTCEAALNNGMRYIGIDNDHISHQEATDRLLHWNRNYIKDLL